MTCCILLGKKATPGWCHPIDLWVGLSQNEAVIFRVHFAIRIIGHQKSLELYALQYVFELADDKVVRRHPLTTSLELNLSGWEKSQLALGWPVRIHTLNEPTCLIALVWNSRRHKSRSCRVPYVRRKIRAIVLYVAFSVCKDLGFLSYNYLLVVGCRFNTSG